MSISSCVFNHFQTKKDKFFVLRSTSSSGPARLEYHDSEKKFKAGQLPKRQILLHKCFNINKKSDTRQKNCIALYLVDECFAVIVKDATEMQIWLDLLLEHQNEYLTEEQQPYPHYGKSYSSFFNSLNVVEDIFCSEFASLLAPQINIDHQGVECLNSFTCNKKGSDC